MPEPVSAVRRAVVVLRYEWLDVRIGGQHASMKGLWPTLLVTAAVVFGCFFVIGRRGSEATSGHEPSSAQGAFSPRAAIPGGLRGGSPIVGSLPSRIATQASSSGAPAQTASAGGHLSAVTAARPLAEDVSSTLAPTQTPTPTPAAAVQTVSVEAPAPVNQHRASVQPANSGGGSHSSSSGGSFDRSE